MELWSKSDFKIFKIYKQSNNVLATIIIGPNKKNYRKVNLDQDEVYYLAYLYTPTPPSFVELTPNKYEITKLQSLDNHTIHVTIEDSHRIAFNGIMCAALSDTIKDFMVLIVSNKQLNKAKTRELERFLNALRIAWESKGKPILNPPALTDFLKGRIPT